MAKKLSKKELVELLINEYGYEKEDLKDAEGKPFTNAKLELMLRQEEEDAKRLAIEKTLDVVKDLKIKDDDLIPVMSGLDGTLIHRSTATGRIWRLNGFGQTVKLPYSEILSIRNNSPSVFDEGWLIILNTQIQEDFGLTKLYENIITPNNLEDVFYKDPDELGEFIDGLPEGMKTTFFAKARELYEEGKLDSRRVIECVENKFGISLKDNAPLSDIVVLNDASSRSINQ